MSTIICIIGWVSKNCGAGALVGLASLLAYQVVGEWSNVITKFPRSLYVKIERQIMLSMIGGGY